MNRALDRAVTGWLDKHRNEFITDLLGLIAIPSVKSEPLPGRPFGQPVGQALDYMLALCRQAGLEVEDVEGCCGEATCGDGDRVVAALSHLDVVPAGDGWTRNPWGELSGSRIFGRGVSDDKGPAMACLYALRALMAAGVPLGSRLRLLFGCDEESGMGDMRRYLALRPAPDYAFSPDARFPVINAEKGIVQGRFHADLQGPTALLGLEGGTRPNVVPGAAQARLESQAIGRLAAAVEQRAHILLRVEGTDIRVFSEGASAHASTPAKGRNAIAQLIDYLAEVLAGDDGALPLLRALRDRVGTATDGSGLGIACRDRESGPLTFSMGLIELAEGRLTVTFDIRHPVTLDMDGTLATLAAALEEMGFTLGDTTAQPGLYLPDDHPLVATLSRIYAEATGRKVRPMSMGGGTYARTLPCAVAFGAIFPGRPETAHMADENVRADDLLSAARVYAHAMAELSNLPGN